MKELVNFFVQTAGCKSPEFINVMCVPEPKCTKKSSPIWSSLQYALHAIIEICFSFYTVLHAIVLYYIVLYFAMEYL